MNHGSHRLVLVDPNDETRAVSAERLRAQGYVVDDAPSGVKGAELALGAPPAAVVSDLWMRGVSGIQLCRLLRAEAGTADVPVVLRAERDDPRSRFWAARAGARALVSKGRMGELVRVLADATRGHLGGDGFFLQLGEQDVRDRIAEHLDRALFESVVAAEVRSLACAASFGRLFDALAQLLAQLSTYAWLAVATTAPPHFGLHVHRHRADDAERQARAALGLGERPEALRIVDDDALDAPSGEGVLVREIRLGPAIVGAIAVAVPDGRESLERILPLVAGELGAVLRLVLLVEESQRLAVTDSLTGLLNRRAFMDRMSRELARCDRCQEPVSILLLDLDHFKIINDTRGHAAGDAVLAAVGAALPTLARPYDLHARWGGEEFVIALPGANEHGAELVAERVRRTIESLVVIGPGSGRVPLTVSVGVAQRSLGEPLDAAMDRADRAMYAAKVGGRNRVCCASGGRP